MRQLLGLILALLLCKPLSQAPPTALQLDAEAGVGGLTFGQSTNSILGFEQLFRKQGKPRKYTQLYKRLADTTQIMGIGQPDSYFFRQGKFIGVDMQPRLRWRNEDVVRLLAARYGPPKADAQSGSYYWLGQKTFIYLSPPVVGQGRLSLLMGSLTLLHELVTEASIRAQARQQLGWKPDSIGLAPQWPKRR
jgi:hypothetical protein